ncbi:MAG: hypothetical protein HQK50_17495 [Oligoflexia bacterium]|nr:hypothetical protein [Oligoflexia bacterium]
MDRKIYNSLVENASFNIKLWQRIAGVLLVSNLLLVIYLVSSDHTEKTVLVPLGLKEAVWVKGKEVSPLYVEQMAQYFFQLLLTYNKQNVLSQYNGFLHYVRPEKYGALKALLMSDVDRIARNDLGSAFYSMKLKVNGMKAEVEGEQVGIVGDKVVSRKMSKYQMEFSYRDGHFSIEAYAEVKP